MAVRVTVTNMAHPMAMRTGLPDESIIKTMPVPAIRGMTMAIMLRDVPVERIVGTGPTFIGS